MGEANWKVEGGIYRKKLCRPWEGVVWEEGGIGGEGITMCGIALIRHNWVIGRHIRRPLISKSFFD